jgi:hypothetical protein
MFQGEDAIGKGIASWRIDCGINEPVNIPRALAAHCLPRGALHGIGR